MALDDVFNVIRPGQNGGTGAIDALHIEEYAGVVEGTIQRMSKLDAFVPVRSVRGTSIFTNNAVGESTLQKVIPGTPNDGTINKFAKKSLQVDTVVLARVAFPLLETWQTNYDSRAEVGREHGQKISKFRDQSFFIQALKAAKLTNTPYTGVQGAGHFGGSQITLAGANDHLDPAKMYAAIVDMLVKMQEKDVDPLSDDVMIGVKPAMFGILSQAELLINQEYVTSAGNTIQGASLLKHSGVPVVVSNNAALGDVISGHLLSNAANSNAYDGDFSKDVVVAFSPRALMAGETIPLTSNVHWNAVYLQWFVDSYLSYAVGPNRPEFAAVISKP